MTIVYKVIQGKPVETLGRKATGLRTEVYDRRVAALHGFSPSKATFFPKGCLFVFWMGVPQ